MKNLAAILFGLCAAAGIARAQPEDDLPDHTTTTTTTPDVTDTTTTDTGTATTTPTTTTPVYSSVPPPPPAAVQPPEPKRPTGYAVGIGVGYDLPTDLQQPNVTSVRFRLASGLTFEPRVVLGFTTLKSGTDSTKSTEIGVAADVRFPRRLHGPVDLVFVGGAGFDRSGTNPPGSDNSTSTLSFQLSYGLGLEYWLGQHFSISATAENPVITLLSTTTETGPGMSDTTSSTTIAAMWAPNVLAFVHLYL